MDDKYPEIFELSKFVQDVEFEEIIDRFENGRTIKELKPERNKVLSVEEFLNTTQEKEKVKREDLIKHLEEVEKQFEKEYHN